jgi:hypothetical protein
MTVSSGAEWADDRVHREPRDVMIYRLTVEPGYLKAELFNRRTAAETREFLNAVAAEGVKHELRCALISVSSSDAIFSLERYGFSAFLDLAAKISDRIALLADSPELRIAHEYAAMLARWRGINVRTFRDEAAAVEWLKEGVPQHVSG